MKTIFSFLMCSALLTLNAQWSTNPEINTHLTFAPNNHEHPKIVEDGNGGAIIVWDEYITSNNSNFRDVYVQSVNASGEIQWTTGGVNVCSKIDNQFYPEIASDGNGGAIIVWLDYRNTYCYPYIYAQRISSSGTLLWTTDDIQIGTIPADYRPHLISDGDGGAIIVWDDYRVTANSIDVFAQKINGMGEIQWTTNGVEVVTFTGNQRVSSVISDGAGGAIISWHDYRYGSGVIGSDIYMQHINDAGVSLWTPDGVAICNATNEQYAPEIVLDGSGGAIVTWQDHRAGSNSDVYAQKISSLGVVDWQTDGIPISISAYDQGSPVIIADNNGGAFIVWEDNRDLAGRDVYIQQVNSLGFVQKTINGIPICTAALGQQGIALISNGSDGFICTWRDFRNDNGNLYAQNISPTGDAQWQTNGVLINSQTTENGFYITNPVIVSDNFGGAVIVWSDARNAINGFTNRDIFTQNICSDGNIGCIPINTNVVDELYSINWSVFPNPSDGKFIIEMNDFENKTIEIFDFLGKKIQTRSSFTDVNEIDLVDQPVGVYFIAIKDDVSTVTGKLILH